MQLLRILSYTAFGVILGLLVFVGFPAVLSGEPNNFPGRTVTGGRALLQSTGLLPTLAIRVSSCLISSNSGGISGQLSLSGNTVGQPLIATATIRDASGAPFSGSQTFTVTFINPAGSSNPVTLSTLSSNGQGTARWTPATAGQWTVTLSYVNNSQPVQLATTSVSIGTGSFVVMLSRALPVASVDVWYSTGSHDIIVYRDCDERRTANRGIGRYPDHFGRSVYRFRFRYDYSVAARRSTHHRDNLQRAEWSRDRKSAADYRRRLCRQRGDDGEWRIAPNPTVSDRNRWSFFHRYASRFLPPRHPVVADHVFWVQIRTQPAPRSRHRPVRQQTRWWLPSVSKRVPERRTRDQ
jgi:hypothetical protein